MPDAINFMVKRGYPNYVTLCGSANGERAPRKFKPPFYAVASGENVGVYERNR